MAGDIEIAVLTDKFDRNEFGQRFRQTAGPQTLDNARLIAAAPDMFEYIRSRAWAGCATAQMLVARIDGNKITPTISKDSSPLLSSPPQ